MGRKRKAGCNHNHWQSGKTDSDSNLNVPQPVAFGIKYTLYIWSHSASENKQSSPAPWGCCDPHPGDAATASSLWKITISAQNRRIITAAGIPTDIINDHKVIWSSYNLTLKLKSLLHSSCGNSVPCADSWSQPFFFK